MPNDTHATNPPQPPPTVRHHPRLIGLFLLVVAALLIADLATKYWAFNHFAEPVDIQAVLDGQAHLPAKQSTAIPGVLDFKLVLNQGAVFGLGQGYTWVFLIVTFVAVGFIGFILFTTPARARLMQVLLAMILAGALGNMIDRVCYAAVRDMFYLFPGVKLPFGWSWGGGQTELYPWIFNLADVYLCIGIALLLLRSIIPEKSPHSA